MNCHRCINIRYDGKHYGRCSHPAHPNVVFERIKKRGRKPKRPYNREKCPDFQLNKRCSICAYWERGKYFRDGKTPSTKGQCILGMAKQKSGCCALWSDKMSEMVKREIESSSQSS